MARRNFGSIVRRRQRDGGLVPANYKGPEPLRPGYYVRVQTGGRAILRRAGETKKEAEQFLGALRHDEWESTVLGVRPVKEIGFKAFAEDYVKLVEREHRPSTARNERWKVENYLVPEFGAMTVSAVKREDVERYLDRRGREGASVSTKNRDAALISAMFKRAVSLGHARTNPVDGVNRPAERRVDVPFLSIEQQDTLVAKCDPTIRTLVAMALDTGMRRGELLGLVWNDVDFDRAVARVVDPKNGSPREVDIRQRSLAMLRAMQDCRPLRGPGAGPDLERVFADILPSFPPIVRDLYHVACAAADLPRLRFHDLRHAAGTNLARAGVPIGDVGKFLGHKTLTMAMRYSHHAPKDAGRRALDTLEAFRATQAKAPADGSASSTG